MEKSKKYKNIYRAITITKGGEAAVYRIDHTDFDQIVAKVTLLDSYKVSREYLNEAYSSIFYET